MPSSTPHRSDREWVISGLSIASRLMYSSPNGMSIRPMRKDRKSTRLNSSHLGISYAVFCLKKKKKKKNKKRERCRARRCDNRSESNGSEAVRKGQTRGTAQLRQLKLGRIMSHHGRRTQDR